MQQKNLADKLALADQRRKDMEVKWKTVKQREKQMQKTNKQTNLADKLDLADQRRRDMEVEMNKQIKKQTNKQTVQQ